MEILIMRKMLPILISVLLLVSCSGEVNPYQAYEPYCIFTPYVTSSGAETAYASVRLMTADAKIPEKCYINGLLYDVVIFDGFYSSSDAGKLYEIELPSFITAISSHAYEQADKVKSVILPENISSLGNSCLPKNLKTITVPAEAICSSQTSSLWDALSTPQLLENVTITGTAQSTVSLKDFGTNECSLKSITIKGYGASWPQMPYPTKEGMKFLGWYTKDPLVYSDAIKAESGKKLSSSTYSLTVYPYWTEGEDSGDTEDDAPQPMEPVNFYKVYSFGINRDYIHLDYNDDTDEYTISLDTTHWFWEWSYNGKPVEMENSSSFTFRKDDGGRVQVICFQCDSEGNASGGAVMIEI